VAFGDALSQEDPQDPLNLPEDALAFFGLNPSNIYERASSCNLDFFSFFLSSSLRYSLIKDRQLQQNCLRLSHPLHYPVAVSSPTSSTNFLVGHDSPCTQGLVETFQKPAERPIDLVYPVNSEQYTCQKRERV
jgi:hypothetical protein